MARRAWTRFAALALVSVAWACGSCGKEQPNEAGRVCRLHSPEGAQHLAPFLADRPLGSFAAHQTVEMRVQLPLRAEDDLDKLLETLYDPKSPQYLRFLTPAQFAARFHPRPSDKGQVRAHLQRHGIMVDSYAPGSVLTARGQSERAERAFGTTLETYKDAAGHVYRAPAAPLGKEGLPPIRAAHGLATHLRRRSLAEVKGAAVGQLNHTFGLSAADIRRAYGLPDDLDGAGEVIGIIAMEGFNDVDIDAYAKANNIRRVPTKRILVGGYDGKVRDIHGQTEVTMDIQLVNALAPAAKEIRVYSGRNAGHGWLDVLREIATPTLDDKMLVRYISCSWGVPEDQMSSADILAENDIFRAFAAQGQVMMVASGDSGSRDDGQHIGTDDPASQPAPSILAVGGTTLTLDSTRLRAQETAWTGSGGGVSCYWPTPFWQTTKLGVPALDNARNVPDVALHADPGGPSGSYNVIVNGQAVSVGGTSCAAPLWTAIAAGVGSHRNKKTLPSLGGWVPHIYRLGLSPQGASLFFHIDQGSNGDFKASPDTDFDNVCGWGSPRGEAFVKAMVGL